MTYSRSLRVGLGLSVLLALAGCGDDDDTTMMDEPVETNDAGPDGEGKAGSTGGKDDASVATGDSGMTKPDPKPGDIPENPDGVDPLPPISDDVALPIVFVHGFAGSAQQFESQAMRFAANGYPQDRILAYDHDGAGVAFAEYGNGVDAVIDQALEDFGVEQVYLVGHSRGTAVSGMYLGDATRAAKVAKYVALDGSPCPSAVPCIAPNQAALPGQAHVEVATSKESFAMMFEFFVGEAPEVTEIVAQREPVTIAGRAVNFPANTGREGTTLELWEIDPETGERVTSEPHASFEIGADGEWGPVTVDSTKLYEQVLSAEGAAQHHLYGQRFLRDDYLVRQLSSGPDGATRTNSNITENHANLVLIRMREWYAMDDGDNPGDESDILEISTTSESGDTDAVNAIVDFVGNGAIGLHIQDDAASPGESTLGELPYFSSQAFQSGVDVFMPAADPPDGVITVKNIPRGDTDRPQVLNVPNWASSNHTISVMFSDSPQD